jgi:hypothetical protein
MPGVYMRPLHCKRAVGENGPVIFPLPPNPMAPALLRPLLDLWLNDSKVPFTPKPFKQVRLRFMSG